MKNHNTPIFFLLILITAWGCSSSDSGNSSDSENIIQEKALIADFKNPGDYFTEGKAAIFSGLIDDKYAISMILMVEEDKARGSYFYKGKKEALLLEGVIMDEFVLTESTEDGKRSGSFTLDEWRGKTLSGTWGNADGSKLFPFELIEQIAFKTVIEAESDSIIEIEVSYMDFPDYPQIAESFKAEFSQPKENFKSDALESKEDILEWGLPWAYSYECSVFGWNTRYISLGVLQYQFSGGAHGNSSVYGSTWDLKSGEMIEISDLYSFDDEFIEKLRSDCRNNLLVEQNYEDDKWFNEGMRDHDFTSFYLGAKGISFSFQSYEIGPYAAGMPEVFIPFDELKEFEMPLLKEIKAAQ